jgi:hypothetical protein
MIIDVRKICSSSLIIRKIATEAEQELKEDDKEPNTLKSKVVRW